MGIYGTSKLPKLFELTSIMIYIVALGGVGFKCLRKIQLNTVPLRGQFLYSELGQKQTFFDTLPPHLIHVVIEWPLGLVYYGRMMFFTLISANICVTIIIIECFLQFIRACGFCGRQPTTLFGAWCITFK